MSPPERPWWWGEGSPGGVGYVLAWLVSVGVASLLVPLEALEDGPLEYVVLTGYLSSFVALVSVPFALVAIPLVHVATIAARAQWVHVLAAASAGALSGALANAWIFDSDLDALPLELALATGLGRAAVCGIARRGRPVEPRPEERVAP